MDTSTDTTEKKTRVITLFDRPPARIVEDEWPVIAQARRWDNQYEFQANRKWQISVRAHADGRHVVYGVFTSQWREEEDRRGGEVVASGDNVTAAIRRVGLRLGFSEAIIDECVGDLPPEAI